MIDHSGVMVTDIKRSADFYKQALAALGYEELMNFGDAVGLGEKKKPDFWLYKGTPKDKLHFAFRAASRTQVKAFYDAAIAAGGKDNGAPGVRPHYHEHYYGAFVLDPDGHNIEAVCHEPYLG
ncbi:MAG TPA: VOC family protein [Kofleriaceae bacterium]|jgi:catechol 2,3-dioxygenase-like lactoylglutathione lyase family enzyme